MTKPIRLILAIAFAIFIVAIIWALVANHRAKKVTTKTPGNQTTNQTIVSQPATTTVAPAAPTPAPSAAPATPSKKTAAKRRVVVTETTETDGDFSGDASASAGTNADGSAWAFAEAN